MHSGFYQPAPPQPDQHSLQTVMGSGFYAGPSAAPLPPPARHSMHEFSARGGSGLLPYGDPAWSAHQQAQHLQQVQQQAQQQQQQQQLGGYSTVLRPSIDRGGLPPLAPRSPNQGAQPASMRAACAAAASGGLQHWLQWLLCAVMLPREAWLNKSAHLHPTDSPGGS
jgi:hypothetical protein